MTLTFADTHNMIAYLTKSNASEGFNQIIDFVNESSIKYALTVNPNIYVSCIKQFWTFVAVKKVNDVTRLQALVDKKKVVVTEATIRDALHLDDAGGVECLPNEEIFTELARMRYEKLSTKLTFYKAFFSSQWKFLIHTILQCMSAKRTSWNEFSSSMASAVIYLSTGRKFNFSKYIFDSLVRNIDSPTKFYMYPRFLQLMIRKQVGDLSSHSTKYTSLALTQKVFANMRRIGKGFSRVDAPLFEGMLVAQEVGEGSDQVHVEDVNADGVVAEGPASDDVNADVDEPSIPSPTPPTPPPQPSQDIPSTSQVQQTPPQLPQAQQPSPQPQPQPSQDAGISMDLLQNLLDTWGIIAHIDADEDVVPEDAKDVAVEKSADVKEIDVVTTAKIITEVVTAASTIITVAALQLTTAAVPQLTTALGAAKKKKRSIIDHVHKKAKEGNAVKRYQALKRKSQTKAQARKNMMIYLKNVVGFKMDYFKRMTYDDIRPIFEKKFNSNVAFLLKTKEQTDEEESRVLKRLNESQEDKASKKQKLDEEVEELKRHIQIVPNDDDDVYTEATPLALKVPENFFLDPLKYKQQ
nr:hypothetical protein [Tanacetum cinerariifolium]